MHKKQYIAKIKNDVEKEDGSNLSIIIPTAKQGKNLRLVGNRSLILNKNDKTLVERQIEIAYHVYPKAEIILVVNENYYKIRKILTDKFDKIRYVYNPNVTESNILYSIALGLFNSNNKKIIIIPGDIFFDENCIDNITNGESSKVLVDTNCYLAKDKVGLTSNNSVIEHFSYKAPIKWGKIVYLENSELRLFTIFTEYILSNNQYNLLFHEGLNDLIDKRGKLCEFAPSPYFLFEINSAADIEKFKKIK